MSEDNKEMGGWLRMTRRGLLQALVSVPVLGVFVISFLKKKAADDATRRAILSELGVSETGPAVIPNAVSRPPSRVVRVGIIGLGYEGESLARYAGFAHPDWIDNARKSHQEDARDKELEVYLGQDDLNVAITGVCDLFDTRAERGIAASSVATRPGRGAALPPAKRYRRYSDMLESGEVDAVVTARPPDCFLQRRPGIRRLFPNYREEEERYFRRTGIFPIMHALGIRRDTYERNRWLAASLYKAFAQAKRIADAEFAETTALKIGLPWVTAEFEATKDAMGEDFWSYGLNEANRRTLTAMARYSYEQGLAVRPIGVEEMFADGNLSDTKV
jgi:hypothetical protein